MKAKAAVLPTCILAWLFAPSMGLTELQAQAPKAAPKAASTVQTAGTTEVSNGSSQDVANDLYVSVGKSVLLDLERPINRISIGSAEIGEVSAVSRTEALVIGKAPGETSLILWQVGGGRQFYNVIVRPNHVLTTDRLSGLRHQLELELPGQKINVTTDDSNIFLRGTVKDLNSSNRAFQIASTLGKVMNLLYVDVPPAPTQILLKVRFASVDRTLTKNLCWNLFSTGATNTVGSVGTAACSTPTVTLPTGTSAATAAVSDALQLFVFRQDLNLGATIQALESKQLLQVLAEPNVMSQDGKEASFLAGGEFPYPVLQGGSSGGSAGITIAYKEFGVRLNFIPTITPRGTIRLQVAPEVSSLDFADGLTISGFNIPAISLRRVRTEVELANEQSFVLGGLLDNTETETFSKIPYLGSIPILGKLFQSITRTKQNTELIVIVTPEIIGPIQAGGALPSLKYPADFLPSNSGIPMTNPGAAATGLQPPAPASASIPVEKLIDSLQPEKPLVIESGSTSTGSYGQNTAGSGPETGAAATGAATAGTARPQ